MQATVSRELAILDFDIENRPLTYLGMDFTTAEITAIAAGFGPDEDVFCWLLGRDDPELMLDEFRAMYDAADMVTGHYIRKHDLPIINGAMLEYGMAPLGPKLTCDTKLDLVGIKGISQSQESLGGLLGIAAPKVHMTQTSWRSANRLEGIELAETRCIADVRQHQLMREELARRGMLRAPQMWHAAG